MYPSPVVSHGINYQSLTNLTQSNEVQQDKKKKSSKTNKTERSTKKPNSYTTRLSNNPRLISPQTSIDRNSKPPTPIHTSRSHNTLQDRIQRERRSHTMAPLTRITGPSSTPQAKMFASTNTPVVVPALKSEHVTHEISNVKSIYNIKSDIEITTDDDTPLIVRVQYDPATGNRPSEAAVRQALDQQLRQQSTPINKNEPIIMNFQKSNIQQQIPTHPINNRQSHPHPSLPPRGPPSSYPLPSQRLVRRLPNPILRNENTHLIHAPKPLINRQSIRTPQLINRNMSSGWNNSFHSKGHNTFKPIHNGMANQQTPTTIDNQQSLLQRPQTAPSGTEMFRPPAVTDIPELSKDNLLIMLNQIPDLQGRQFNIEYAPSTAPDGYPIPLNLDNSGNAYPEPLVIDKLPNNIIQHVRSSNNPALTAALEATIQHEQNTQARVSTLNPQPPMVMHHSAQPHQQVQQSRSVSSDDSDSSTETTSSETSSSSSSEETDSEDSESASSYSE